MRFFAGLVAVFLLIGAAWNKYITQGGLVAYYDAHPKSQSGAKVLYTLGKGYEVVSNYDKMLEVYGRLYERYPDSEYGDDALFGVAFALERTNRFKEAVEKYQEFMEKYPGSKYARSVRNNIEILKSR